MNPTQVVRYLTSSPMRGAALGAGIGAASRAVQTPAEGQSRGGAMLQGAVRGAALGGLASGAGRAYRDTRLLRPELGAAAAVPATARRVGTEIANFGRRQVHGFTGHYNPDAIGMGGNAAAGKQVDLLKRRAMDEVRHNPNRAEELLGTAQREITDTLAKGRKEQSLQDAGITSVRGIVRAMRDPNQRSTALRAMGSTLTSGAGPGGAAMALGVPVAMAAPSLARGDESAVGGQTVGQKVKGLGAGMLAGAAVGGLPLIPQIVAGGALDAGAKRLVQGRKAE